MKVTGEEMAYIVQRALQDGFIDPLKDTAVLFQSWDVLAHRINVLRRVWPGVHHAIPIKTQPHTEVLQRLVAWGVGLEAASLEEVQYALAAKCPASYLLFDSPVKTHSEIAWCHANAPGMVLNANSLEELSRHPTAPSYRLGLRINPEIYTGAPTFFHVSNDGSKFGVAISRRKEVLQAIDRYPISGLHMHSGSQITCIDRQIEALAALVDLAYEANARLESAGLERRIAWLDIGGGIPAEPWEIMEFYAAQAVKILRGCGNVLEIYTEFGQWVHAEAGWALSAVEYVLPRSKGNPHVAFIHLGADYFLRDVYTTPRSFPLTVLHSDGRLCSSQSSQSYNVAGPLCFGGDYLAHAVLLPELHEGYWLAIGHTGANTYGLWSRHCSRTVPKMIGYSIYNEGLISILSERRAEK